MRCRSGPRSRRALGFRARRLSISRSNPATTSVTPTTRLMATAAANRFRVSTTPTARVRAPRARTGFHGRSIGAEEGDTTESRLDVRVGLPSKAAARGRPDDDRGVPGRPPGSPGEVENWAEHHGRSDQRGPISPPAPGRHDRLRTGAHAELRVQCTDVAAHGVDRQDGRGPPGLSQPPEIRCLVAPTAGCCPVFPREPRAHGYGSSSSSRPPQGQARGSTPPPARTSAHVAAGSPVARIDGAEGSNLISRRHCV